MVESTGNKILLKVGTGRVYPFPVRFIDASDVHCFVNVNGVERELVASEFSVERKDDYSDGANITLNIDPLPTGATLAIVRQCDPVQLVSFPINGKFPSKGNENALDKLTMIVQDLYERLNRAIAGSVTDSTAVVSYDEFKKFLDQAVSDSASAKNLVEEWLERFANLTADSTGRLFWKGCEVLTRCNIGDIGGGGGSDGEDGSGGSDGSDGEDGSGGSDGSDGEDGEDGKDGRPGEIIVVGEGDTSKGYVEAYCYRREIIMDIFHGVGVQKDGSCRFDLYMTSANFNWEKALAFGRTYGYLTTQDGYEEIWEDEDGKEVVDCMVDDSTSPYCNEDGKMVVWDSESETEKVLDYDSDKTLAEMNEDVQSFLAGELHYDGTPPTTPYAFPSTGWSGYKWYRIIEEGTGSGGNMYSAGDTIRLEMNNRAGWYSAWGDRPCGQSPMGTGFGLYIDTTVFLWHPNDDYDGPAPDKVFMIGDDGVRRAYDFNTEYSLPGMDYIKKDWYKLVTCPDAECPYPVLQCIVKKLPGMENTANSTDTPYYQPDVQENPVFTYEGVLFGGEE